MTRQQVRRMYALTRAEDREKNRHLLQGMALRLERQAGLQMTLRGVGLLRSRGVIPENMKNMTTVFSRAFKECGISDR